MDDFALQLVRPDAGLHRQGAWRAPGAGPSLSSPGMHSSGWHESSWDLLRGLEVREGLPADVTPSEWLEHCLLS